MKLLETHFDEYLQNVKKINLHPNIKQTIQAFPSDLSSFKNIIFYGPPGVGKYSQVLFFLSKFSPSLLKYEKKLLVQFDKVSYYFKISDIHFEIDMALLGCNSKSLWNEIFINIVDVLSARPNKTGIIVCKNFHKIHSELLDVIYSYFQKNFNNIFLHFILITEHVSFLPDNIINSFKIISLPRPIKSNYNKILPKKIDSSIQVNSITNIKNLFLKLPITNSNEKNFCLELIPIMENVESLKFMGFRDLIYDIFIYNLDVNIIILEIIKYFSESEKINKDNLSSIIISAFNFLQYYNNNYRPIYHLELFLFNIINIIYGFE
jgi:hypothetical protein